MKQLFAAMVLGMALLGSASVLPAAVIYSDTFSGFGSLDGSSPDVTNAIDGGSSGAAWSSTLLITLGGAATISGDDDGAGRAGYLPFVPVSGKVYTLSVDMNPINSSSDNWLAFGFTNNTNFLSDTKGVFELADEGSPWLLYRENGAGTNFSSSLNDSSSFGADVDSSDPLRIVFTLDTTGASWTATATEYNLVTNSFGPGSGWTHTYGSNPSITGIFLGGFSTGSGSFDNLELATSSVPEPSTYLLCCAGLAVLFVLRQKSKKSDV